MHDSIPVPLQKTISKQSTSSHQTPNTVQHYTTLLTLYIIMLDSKHSTSSHSTTNTVHYHIRLQTQYSIRSDAKHSTSLPQTQYNIRSDSKRSTLLHQTQTQYIITSNSKHSTALDQTSNTVQHYIRLQTQYSIRSDFKHTQQLKTFCRGKHTFVATKILLVAAPANDRRQAVYYRKERQGLQNQLSRPTIFTSSGRGSDTQNWYHDNGHITRTNAITSTNQTRRLIKRYLQ